MMMTSQIITNSTPCLTIDIKNIPNLTLAAVLPRYTQVTILYTALIKIPLIVSLREKYCPSSIYVRGIIVVTSGSDRLIYYQLYFFAFVL